MKKKLLKHQADEILAPNNTTNSPRRAADFATLADRRAWIDELPDERVRITTSPTRKRLRAANDNVRLSALDAADALLAPHTSDCLPDPFEMLGKESVGNGWRMRPEPQEIQRAMLGRVAVRTAKGRTHAERWPGRTWHIGPLVFTMARRTESAPVLSQGVVVTGNVLVTAGALIARGTGKKGPLKPSEYRTFEKPTTKGARSAASVRRYVELVGAWETEPARRVAVEPLGSGRTALFEGVRTALDSACGLAAVLPDGAPPITYLPPGYGDPEGFFGGVSRFHGGGSGHDAHATRAQDEAVRIIVQRWLSENVNAHELRLLALATSSATASEAGADLGMTRQRYVDAANDALDKVARLLAA